MDYGARKLKGSKRAGRCSPATLSFFPSNTLASSSQARLPKERRTAPLPQRPHIKETASQAQPSAFHVTSTDATGSERGSAF
jgi:hypothetical protein